MIDFYTAPTPNGRKVAICLEELGLEYRVHRLHLSQQEQKQPWYLEINPNGRIPAIVDRDNGDFAVFESGAIMFYLAEKTGRLLPSDPKGRSRVLQWLMFQMAGLGPMMGQNNVFSRFSAEKVPSVIEYYRREVRRLFEVLDGQLAKGEFLAGDYSIADIANWSWAQTYEFGGLSIDGLPHLQRWIEAVRSRPAVQRGLDVPERRSLPAGNADKAAQAPQAPGPAVVEQPVSPSEPSGPARKSTAKAAARKPAQKATSQKAASQKAARTKSEAKAGAQTKARPAAKPAAKKKASKRASTRK